MKKIKGWENAIIFTKKEFENFFGKCPDWLWEILVENYQKMQNEGNTNENYKTI